MCGIVGIYSPSRCLPSEEDFAGACVTLRHRGPDDQGVFHDDIVMFGHRRLSIIDLNSGHQPIHNEDRSLWTVYNGEIYNYLELREELEALGHQFYTASDTEVIVHAYEEWGVEGFARLRGMFAIAISDRRARSIVLARDPLGKKPLYLTRQGDRYAFASELKALCALPDFNFSLDPEACRDYALMGYVPTPVSIYREVKKVKPGWAVTVKDGDIEERRFWRMSFQPKHSKSEADLLEELDTLLREAVRLRLRSDVPFGAFLSGGLDSSIVTALMAEQMEMPVKTFSIGFREAAFDELEDARLIARHIQADHHEHIVSADAVGLLERLVWHFDEPFADSSAIPTYLVAEAAAKHVKMVLSGDGGDEAFGGYERYLKQQVVERLRLLSAGLAGPALKAIGGVLPSRFGARLSWLGERASLPFPARYISGVALCTPSDAVDWLASDSSAGRHDYGTVERRFSHGYGNVADEMIHGDIETYLLDDILVKVDRMTMANSLEARAPLLDVALIEWAARLPNSMKMRDGKGKHLLRRLAGRYLPAETLTKKKKGFSIPLAQWFRTDLYEMMADTITSNAFAECGVFDRQAAEKMLAEHLEDDGANHGEKLWQMLVMSLWYEHRGQPVDTVLPTAQVVLP
ncbi:MAG: asparagine synthase (glutamine-hydrolyzing) [Pseudomonadota bacterium]